MEALFLNGLIFKMPRENAPDFIKGSLSIKREEMIQALSELDDDWINLDLKVSRQGKSYAQINEWKPSNQQEQDDTDKELF